MPTVPDPRTDAEAGAEAATSSKRPAPWRERAFRAVSDCIEPLGTFGSGWEGRYAAPDENEYETELIEFAPALARLETDDVHDGTEVFDRLKHVDVSGLTRLLGRQSQVMVERGEDDGPQPGLRVTGQGRLLGRAVTVIIHCDEPFEDAAPRIAMSTRGGELAFIELDGDDEEDGDDDPDDGR
jgi:hypothetical protein